MESVPVMTDFPTFLAHTTVTRIKVPASKHHTCPYWKVETEFDDAGDVHANANKEI